MKIIRILVTAAAAVLATSGTLAGPVYFPITEMTGLTNDVVVNVRALNNPVLWNNRFYYLPEGGTNLTTSGGLVTNTFVPGTYTVTIGSLAQSWTLYVTNNTTAVSAVELSRGITRYSGIQSLSGYGSATVTNDALGNYGITATGGSGGVSSNEVVAIMRTNAAGFATNANYATTATNWGTAEMLLNPPHIGPIKTTGNYAEIGNNTPFLYLSGSGIVRSLWSVPVIGYQWTNSPQDLRLQVYCDIGSNTNPPTAALKCLEIPLSELQMRVYRFASNGNYSTSFDSRFLAVNDQSTNTLMGHAVRTFMLKAPQYFTNGILFRITNAAVANTLWSNGYLHAVYEPGTLPATYADYRLKNIRYSGGITGGTSNYLGKVNSGSGLIVGAMQSALAANATGDLVSFVDSHALRFDFSSTFYESTGGDDFFNSTYGFVIGQNSLYDTGSPNVVWESFGSPDVITLPFVAESYRWFGVDHLSFTSGFTLSIRPLAGLVDSRINVLYYAP